jgi:hypothetical protein
MHGFLNFHCNLHTCMDVLIFIICTLHTCMDVLIFVILLGTDQSTYVSKLFCVAKITRQYLAPYYEEVFYFCQKICLNSDDLSKFKWQMKITFFYFFPQPSISLRYSELRHYKLTYSLAHGDQMSLWKSCLISIPTHFMSKFIST